MPWRANTTAPNGPRSDRLAVVVCSIASAGFRWSHSFSALQTFRGCKCADPLLQGRMAELKAVHDTSRSGSHFASCEKIEKRIDKRHITMQSGML
jgi:hypothetical protein